MNCIHKPDNYKKLLTEGDAGMVCRHCKKPIRIKDKSKSDRIRLILVILPILLFCIIAGTDISAMLPGKAALLACFFACLGISVFGWLAVCRFVLEYVELPEAPAEDETPADK